MEKRKIIFGTYDTAHTGLWTLAALALTNPEYQEHFVEVKGKNGPLDFSTVLTDGEPTYGPRTLSATLESSEGSRAERRARISDMVNDLDGYRMNIYHPDHPGYYLTGRVKIQEEYNDLAHCAVFVTATCDPWLYAIEERAYHLTAATTKKTAILENLGRRKAVPLVTVTGENASFLIECGAYSIALGPGTWQLPELLLGRGNTQITYSGTGKAKITYREAVLR